MSSIDQSNKKRKILTWGEKKQLCEFRERNPSFTYKELGRKFEVAENTTDNPDAVYAKQIDQYQQIIDRQQAQLKKAQYEHPDLYRQFTDDINQLDSAYRKLKTSLENNPNTEMLLEAMIRNLQIQSELLTRQLSIIKEIKQKSKA